MDTSSAPTGADKRKHRQFRWLEARVVAAQAHGGNTIHYGATVGDVAVAGAAGWGVNTQLHYVAPQLAHQAATRFVPTSLCPSDLYHVCDCHAAVWPGD